MKGFIEVKEICRDENGQIQIYENGIFVQPYTPTLIAISAIETVNSNRIILKDGTEIEVMNGDDIDNRVPCMESYNEIKTLIEEAT